MRKFLWLMCARVGAIQKLAAGLLLSMVGVAGNALGDDLNPPPWRGLPLTTYAEWEFLNPLGGIPDGPGQPIVGDGAGGQLPTVTPVGGIHWDPVFNGSWIGDTGGGLEFFIPNWIDQEPWKWLQVQITYMPNPLVGPPSVQNLVAFDPNGISGIGQVSANDVLIDPLNNLFHRTEVWQIFPNPDWERFFIPIYPDVVVTQVVVDSWSVPEPGTFALSAVGAALVAATIRRRRR